VDDAAWKDDAEWARQNAAVRSKVQDAAADLILEMMEFQKQDQQRERIEANSSVIKSISSSRRTTNLRAAMAAVEAKDSERRKERGEAEGDADDAAALNPYKRKRGSNAHSGLWITGKDLPSAELLLQQQQEALERDRLEAEASGDAIPCSNCGSKLTYHCNLMAYDISKGEVWGAKDVNDTAKRVQCKECKHVMTIVAES